MSILANARTSVLNGIHTTRKGLSKVNDVAERFDGHATFGAIAERVGDLAAQATDLIDGVEAEFLNDSTAKPQTNPVTDSTDPTDFPVETKRAYLVRWMNARFGYPMAWDDEKIATDFEVSQKFDSNPFHYMTVPPRAY